MSCHFHVHHEWYDGAMTTPRDEVAFCKRKVAERGHIVNLIIIIIIITVVAKFSCR